MELIIKKNYDELSKAVGDFVIDYVEKKPHSLICFAGGDTPLGLLKYLVKAAEENKVDLSKCKFVGLDEWVGLGRDVKGSCQETLYNNFYDLIPVPKEQVCFFEGLAKDLDDECKRVDSFISDNGNLDLIVLGIGMNGHIGFNEPDVPTDTYSHIVDLDPVTKEVSVKYFDMALDVKQGMSLGMKTILEADTIVLMADSERKADIVYKTIHSEKTVKIPSTLVKDAEKAYFFIDEAAGKLL
jgi:glucosamine-6-phosphate deaminase